MSRQAGAPRALFRGIYAVDWGLAADEPVLPGMPWRWQGRALRLDRGGPALWLGRPLARGDMRSRARARLARQGRPPALRAAHDPGDATPAEALPPGGVVLTDGLRLFPARLVWTAGRMAAVFDPWLPAPGTELWVAAAAPPPAAPEPHRGLVCGLAAGSLVETASGPRPAESLAPGDMVLTRDHGLQPVLWRGETRLGGAELMLHPHLRPLLVTAEGPALRLAPGQRLAVPGLPGLWGQDAALARAADLGDSGTRPAGRLRRDLACRSVTYVHLLLPYHALLRVQGLDCASFHPALADPAALRWHARGLERALPGLSSAPGRYGEPVARCLSRAEAALLAYAA